MSTLRLFRIHLTASNRHSSRAPPFNTTEIEKMQEDIESIDNESEESTGPFSGADMRKHWLRIFFLICHLHKSLSIITTDGINWPCIKFFRLVDDLDSLYDLLNVSVAYCCCHKLSKSDVFSNESLLFTFYSLILANTVLLHLVAVKFHLFCWGWSCIYFNQQVKG